MGAGDLIISTGIGSVAIIIGLKLSLSEEDPPPDARCGAACSLCSSFSKRHCPSCAYGPEPVRLSCPVFVCAEKKETFCTECPDLFYCPIYKAHKKTCPFENSTVLADTLPAGGYLIREQTLDVSLTAFSDRIARGDLGLLILRQSPDVLLGWPYLEKVPIVCLQQTIPQDNSLDPTNLAKLHLTIQEFVKTAPRATVLLEGMEYLIVHNGVDRIVKFLHSIVSCAEEYSSRFITLIDPRVLQQDELDLIERELKQIQSW
jgi:hypothetical protein